MYKPKHTYKMDKDYHPRFPSKAETDAMIKSHPRDARLYSTTKPFGDKDKDGTPNFIDCYPGDPNRHGAKHIPSNLRRAAHTFGHKVARPIGMAAAKGVAKVESYIKGYPERTKQARQRKLEKFKQEIEIEKSRISLESKRAELSRLREKRSKQSGSYGLSLGGYSGIGDHFGIQPQRQSVVKPIKRRKSSKKKRRRK